MSEETAREALRLAAHKLPVKCKFVKREGLEEAKMKANELRDMSAAELTKKLAELKEELFNLRFQHAINQLENPGRIETVKKDIARVKTVMRSNELKDAQ